MAITACQLLQASDYGSMNQQIAASMAAGWKVIGEMIVTNSPRDFYQLMYQGNNTAIEAYQAIINDAQGIPVRNSSGSISESGTASVSQNTLTAVALPATSTIVKAGDTNISLLPASGSTALLTGQSADVATGALTGIRLAGANTVTKQGDTVPVANSANTSTATGTATVSANAVQRVSLPANNAIASNSQVLSIPVTSGILLAIGTATRNVTLTVANGVISAASIS